MPVKKKPSPAQLAARAKFVAMVRAKAAAKKKAAPKVGAVKKKVAPKKVVAKKMDSHKDNKSHNVNIRVISGIELSKKELIELKLKSEKAVDYANSMGQFFTEPGSKSLQIGFDYQFKCYKLLKELEIKSNYLNDYTKKMYQQAKSTYNYWKK
jgi:hypothetical protein